MLTVLHVESKYNFLQKIQDSFPCTYMHVQVSTSYFNAQTCISLQQFPIVGCGQISLLMPKTHLIVQRGSISLLMKLISLFCLLGHLKVSQIYVCVLDFCFTILHVHCFNLYK